VTWATIFYTKENKMITEQQIDMLVDMYGLEWVDYIEYVNEGKENDEI